MPQKERPDAGYLDTAQSTPTAGMNGMHQQQHYDEGDEPVVITTAGMLV